MLHQTMKCECQHALKCAEREMPRTRERAAANMGRGNHKLVRTREQGSEGRKGAKRREGARTSPTARRSTRLRQTVGQFDRLTVGLTFLPRQML